MGFRGTLFSALLLAFSFSHMAGATIPRCAGILGKAGDYRTLDQVLKELHGGDPLNPSPRSRLGRYLKQSGAASAIKRFAKDKEGNRGAQKLVVAVSPETFPLFFQLFGAEFPNALEHLHTPQQGTLLVRWMTQTFSYASARGRWRFPTVGSIGPMILLSDSEASRLHDYWLLAGKTGGGSKEPWDIEGYNFPRDAYAHNCTTWIGHIPLGDSFLEEVVSAGSIDQWGDGAGRAPRRGTVTAYPLPEGTPNAQLWRKVWSAPVRERLWDLLGVEFGRANHANPGWVALTLTGMTSAERVPFVILYTDDHTVIPRRLDSQIHLVGG